MAAGLAPRRSAHAVKAAPLAQAAKISAMAASRREARSEGRSWARGLCAVVCRPGIGAADSAGVEPGSDSPG